jgi:hypothetical protein
VRVLEDASADVAMKANAAHVLGVLAAATKIDNVLVVAAGAIPLLAELLSSVSEKGREKAAGMLWSLGVGNNAYKIEIAPAGAIPPLVHLLDGGSEEGRANGESHGLRK